MCFFNGLWSICYCMDYIAIHSQYNAFIFPYIWGKNEIKYNQYILKYSNYYAIHLGVKKSIYENGPPQNGIYL